MKCLQPFASIVKMCIRYYSKHLQMPFAVNLRDKQNCTGWHIRPMRFVDYGRT